MANEEDETLERLARADHLCDRYEEILQTGSRISPVEYLQREGTDPTTISAEVMAELGKLEKAYRSLPADSGQIDTQAFERSSAKRVGRYELRRPLGSGGFGEVWVAFDPHLDREIAIKIPHKGVLADSAAIDRFYREARSAAKLKHPNIVRIHDAGSDGSTHFIAAELIAGKTLREFCSAEGLEIRMAVRIVADLAAAVHYAHRNQIIHRDIKPGNVLMDAADQPHLADFGLASQLDTTGLTTKGTVLGTPIYMAPEQAAGRFGAALPACDQYSLGTVLYELLTGRPPFSGSTSVVLYHKLNSSPPPPRLIRPEIPPEVEAICMRAMERIPEKRYPDCEAMAADLRAWLAGTLGAKSKLRANTKWIALAMTISFVVLLVSMSYWQPWARNEVDKYEKSLQGDAQQVGKPLDHEVDAIVKTEPSRNSVTPPNVKFIDAIHTLPLHPDRPRKVVDFIEVHGASFDRVSNFLRALGPDYFPSVLGEHATADPPQFHAIAYRVNLPVNYRVDTASSVGRDMENRAKCDQLNYRMIQFAGNVQNDGPDGSFLRISISDTDYFSFLWGRKEHFDEQIAYFKNQKHRPILLIPRYHLESGACFKCAIGAYDRNNWSAAQSLTIEKLKKFADDSKTEKRFLFQIRSVKGQNGEADFAAIAFDNSDNLDWDFRFDMSSVEYESELHRRKTEGFRPTTVTSYGDPNNPLYAAAWIRYFIPQE